MGASGRVYLPAIKMSQQTRFCQYPERNARIASAMFGQRCNLASTMPRAFAIPWCRSAHGVPPDTPVTTTGLLLGNAGSGAPGAVLGKRVFLHGSECHFRKT
jgi:hypothetical protein